MVGRIFNVSRHWKLSVILLLAVVFFLVYAWFYYGFTQMRFASPDETSNYYFIKLLSAQGKLSFVDGLNAQLHGILTPRSIGYHEGMDVPGSFLGIILIVGVVAKLIGIKAAMLFVPVLSSAAVVIFFFLIKKIFDENIAFVSSLAMFVLPPFWYYSSRGMFHNVMFIDLLIIGLYCFMTSIEPNRARWASWALSVAAAICVALALLSRTSEFLWVGVLFLVLIVRRFKALPLSQWLVCIGVALALVAPLFVLNSHLYGSPTSFAYFQGSSENVSNTVASTASAALSTFWKVIFPFTFAIPRIFQKSVDYLIKLYPWFSVPLIISLLVFFKDILIGVSEKIFGLSFSRNKIASKSQSSYVATWLIVSIWLVVYYGSFTFSEQTGTLSYALGSSYVRYWLPIYVFALPIVVSGLWRIACFFRHNIIRQVVGMLLVMWFVASSVIMVLSDPLHGLYQIKQNVAREISVSRTIQARTVDTAVIIAGSADKVFFPDRRVIVQLPGRDGDASHAVNTIISQTEIYLYYNPLDDGLVKTKELLLSLGYRLEEWEVFDQEGTTLFRIYNT